MIRLPRADVHNNLVDVTQLPGPVFTKEGFAATEPGLDRDYPGIVNRLNQGGEGFPVFLKPSKSFAQGAFVSLVIGPLPLGGLEMLAHLFD